MARPNESSTLHTPAPERFFGEWDRGGGTPPTKTDVWRRDLAKPEEQESTTGGTPTNKPDPTRKDTWTPQTPPSEDKGGGGQEPKIGSRKDP